MKLSIIIVNYNVKYFLEQCLLSIEASHIDFDIEIFVVDNNSSDDSVEYIKSRFPLVKFIANKDNPGFSKANNQAIKLATGKYILILNPDTVLGENVLTDTVSLLDKNKDVGAVGVKMINGNGLFLAESKRGFPSPWASFCKIFGLSKLFPYSPFFGQYHLKYLDENKSHYIDVLAGAFIMVRKSILDKIGLFDEDFFMYGEDIDLSYRISQSGFKNYYLPVKIIHYKGESTKKGDLKYIKAFYNAMYIFFKKHYPGYGKVYSLFIKAGIYTRASLSTIKNLTIKKTSQNKRKSKINHEIKLMDHSILSYEDIISIMDTESDKNIVYHIYSPQSGMIIGSNYAKIQKDVTGK